MRKILFISLAALLVIALSACAGKEETASVSAPPEPSNTPEASVTEPSVQQTEAPEVQKTPGSIIAESSNTVSDKETEQILDKLSDELENALGGAEDFEDLDNTDLNTDNIE